MKEENEGLDNTNAIANIVETGDLHEVAMILGSRERIRHAGVIRPGIKIPLTGCTEAQKSLYTSLLDEGCGFEFIDGEMLKIAPKDYGKKTCLRPANSDYFTIRDADFKRKEDAEYIRSHYADPDGRVRRIPCWLPTSDIEKVIPHNFRAFSAGGLRCVSFYEGSRLKFRYLPKDFKGTPKEEDWRILDSDDENEATKACGIKVAFGGMYRVYVPGTRGAGEIVCPTQSWYGLGESVGVLKRVRSILGRFDGLFQGNAYFELCKVAEMVKTPDGKKQQQFIVTLELAVDPMELARYAEKLPERGPRSLAILNGEPLKAPATFEPPVLPPVADEPAEGTTDAPEVSPEIAGAIAAIEKLTTAANIPVEHFEAFVSYSKGVSLAALTIEELRKLYAQVKKSLANESAAEDFRSHCQQCFEGGNE